MTNKRIVVNDSMQQGYVYTPVSYTHLTLPTTSALCRSRWSPEQ